MAMVSVGNVKNARRGGWRVGLGVGFRCAICLACNHLDRLLYTVGTIAAYDLVELNSFRFRCFGPNKRLLIISIINKTGVRDSLFSVSNTHKLLYSRGDTFA